MDSAVSLSPPVIDRYVPRGLHDQLRARSNWHRAASSWKNAQRRSSYRSRRLDPVHLGDFSRHQRRGPLGDRLRDPDEVSALQASRLRDGRRPFLSPRTWSRVHDLGYAARIAGRRLGFARPLLHLPPFAGAAPRGRTPAQIATAVASALEAHRRRRVLDAPDPVSAAVAEGRRRPGSFARAFSHLSAAADQSARDARRAAGFAALSRPQRLAIARSKQLEYRRRRALQDAADVALLMELGRE